MPEKRHQDAVKKGLISQKQYSKLPSALLDGIIKKKKGESFYVPKKGRKRVGQPKGSRLAFDDTKQERKKKSNK